MVHRQLGLWPMLCILYKLLQLIKNIKVSGGGLIVTLGATALNVTINPPPLTLIFLISCNNLLKLVVVG